MEGRGICRKSNNRDNDYCVSGEELQHTTDAS